MDAKDYNPYKGGVWENKGCDDFDDKMKYLERQIREAKLTPEEWAYLQLDYETRYKYYFYNPDGSPPMTRQQMDGPNQLDILAHAMESKRRQDLFNK